MEENILLKESLWELRAVYPTVTVLAHVFFNNKRLLLSLTSTWSRKQSILLELLQSVSSLSPFPSTYRTREYQGSSIPMHAMVPSVQTDSLLSHPTQLQSGSELHLIMCWIEFYELCGDLMNSRCCLSHQSGLRMDLKIPFSEGFLRDWGRKVLAFTQALVASRVGPGNFSDPGKRKSRRASWRWSGKKRTRISLGGEE